MEAFLDAERQKQLATRLAVVLLSSTFLDDGAREALKFDEQCRLLTSTPDSAVRFGAAGAALYVLASLLVQLAMGGYLAGVALRRPAALAGSIRVGPLQRVPTPGPRYAALVLLAFIGSSTYVYGVGLPERMHEEGRLIFLLRNCGIAGALLQLVAGTLRIGGRRRWARLGARLLLAAHGLQIAPLRSMPPSVALWSCPGCDVLSLPLALALALGWRSRTVAALLCAVQLGTTAYVSRLWEGLGAAEYVRFYLMEDVSIAGGLLLLAAADVEPGEPSVDGCRAAAAGRRRGWDGGGRAEGAALLGVYGDDDLWGDAEL